MKPFVAYLLFSLAAAALAQEEEFRFISPPFAAEDMEIPAHSHLDNLSYEELRAISVEELRGHMANGAFRDQRTAALELVERGDQKTILRLVYSLKQGNVEAEDILGRAHTLAAVPYLMEDVAHGSLDYYGSYRFGDSGTSDGSVRELVVTHVASTLFRASEFTGETRQCLRAIIGKGDSHQIQGLSDESKYLIQWWLLNQSAFEAGKWDETRPLPQEISYLDPREDTAFPRDASWDPEKHPPYGSPLWELPESFEAWSARIVDPKRRNFDFVALSWDGKKVIEHPAKSLDPKVKPEDRESRKTPAPRNPAEPKPGGGAGTKGILWITMAAILIAVLSLVRWLTRKSAA